MGPGPSLFLVPFLLLQDQQADMDIIIHYGFAAEGTYWQARCELEKDPNLSVGDVIEPVDNIWPGTVDEVNYVVEEEKKIYTLQMERGHEEDFLDKARKSQKWILTPEQ